MNDCAFDKQALIDLINNVQLATGRKQEYFYYCYNEPSDEVKRILKEYGLEYKIIPNVFTSKLNVDEQTAFVFPKCKQYIKLEFD